MTTTVSCPNITTWTEARQNLDRSKQLSLDLNLIGILAGAIPADTWNRAVNFAHHLATAGADEVDVDYLIANSVRKLAEAPF